MNCRNREEEFVFRGGKLDGTIIKEICGALPSFAGYHGTGRKDENNRWILITDAAATEDSNQERNPQ